MMTTLHPTYSMQVRVQGDALKGGDWDHIAGHTGCDEALAKVRKALADAGLRCEVFFDKFDHVAPI